VIALYDDLAVLGRTPDSALALQHAAQLPEIVLAADESRHERYLLACPPLAVDPYTQVLARRRQRLGLGFLLLGSIPEVGIGRIDHA